MSATKNINKNESNDENAVNLNEFCRLCMTRDSVNIDIFDDNESVSLPLRIMACASLEVSQFKTFLMNNSCRFYQYKSCEKN